jgi:hypothetical protein
MPVDLPAIDSFVHAKLYRGESVNPRLSSRKRTAPWFELTVWKVTFDFLTWATTALYDRFVVLNGLAVHSSDLICSAGNENGSDRAGSLV